MKRELINGRPFVVCPTRAELLEKFAYSSDGKILYRKSKEPAADEEGMVMVHGVKYPEIKIIWTWHVDGYPARKTIYCHNGNPNDMRIENLRQCNIPVSSTDRRSVSGIAGITRPGTYREWLVRIKLTHDPDTGEELQKPKYKQVGEFDTLRAAKMAYFNAVENMGLTRTAKGAITEYMALGENGVVVSESLSPSELMALYDAEGDEYICLKDAIEKKRSTRTLHEFD